MRQSSAYHVQNNLASQKLQYVMLYEALEERGVGYAIRIPANENLERDVAELQPRPVGRPGLKPLVEYKSFLHQAPSWKRARWWAKWSMTRASYSHEWASSSRT